MKTRLLILLIGLLSAGCLGRRTANDNTDNNVTAALPAADSAVAETAVAETAVAPVCDSIPEANPEARNFERHGPFVENDTTFLTNHRFTIPNTTAPRIAGHISK